MKNIQSTLACSFLFCMLSSTIYCMSLQDQINGMKLLNAVAQGNITEIEKTLKNGAHINYQAEGSRNSALHIAALFNHNQDAVKILLIQHKIDQTLKECFGRTADDINQKNENQNFENQRS